MKMRGFTLIELMITIAVIAIIALVGIPITGKWVQGADLDETEAQLIEALGRAKASGLRNPSGSTGLQQVAIVCVDSTNKVLKVNESTSSSAATCDSSFTNTTWQAKIDSDVDILNGSENALSCVCTNNKGIFFKPTTGTCSSCYDGNNLIVKTGSKKQTFSIF